MGKYIIFPILSFLNYVRWVKQKLYSCLDVAASVHREIVKAIVR